MSIWNVVQLDDVKIRSRSCIQICGHTSLVHLLPKKKLGKEWLDIKHHNINIILFFGSIFGGDWTGKIKGNP